MSKPNTMLDLLGGGHIGLNDVNVIARAMFNDATTMAGPEGYLITGVNFDTLPEHVQGFIRKAILAFTVENVFDAHSMDPDDENMELDSELLDTSEAEKENLGSLDPFDIDGYEGH